ncbi:MAG: phosphatidylglycerol lysyltransferase domain-containing protein [Paracoccaceae bacterium]|nr:phosphatidylglycerol lysyltransferase domain-containing protein [Paracoccaceae bacterium]
MAERAIPIPAGLPRQIPPLAVGVLCLWLIWQQAQMLDWQAVLAAFAAISPLQWLLALAASAASFVAVAQYDVISHRHFDTGVPAGQAGRAGAAAIALGQTLGFGPAVGAAVRWRLLPGLGHGDVLRVTGFVTLTFLTCWAVMSLGFALPVLSGQGWMVLVTLPALILGGAVLLWRFPRLALLGRQIELPSLPAAGRLLVLSACDLICAALVLYVLLPSEIAPTFLTLLAAFVLALGAGMIGGTPGGVGPFELTLAAMLPGTDMATLAACLLAYRAAYYALPALLAGLWCLIARPTAISRAALPAPDLRGPRAELAIVAQSRPQVLRAHGAEAITLRCPQTSILFLGPTQGDIKDLLQAHETKSKSQNRIASLYKLTARDAIRARRAGWQVQAFAQEAVITLQGFDLATPGRRQLRRALRKATQAGVEVQRLSAPDWRALAEVNATWAAAHGGERGLTMGRFCPDYLQDKPLFAAYHQGRLVAFVSAVEAPGALCLDLIRHEDDIPTGTMQALVCAMIEHARDDCLAELSLAAVPHPALGRLGRSKTGLTRFKQSFAPRWRPLYIAAPGPLSLAFSAAAIWQEIHRPEPLPPTRTNPLTADPPRIAGISQPITIPALRPCTRPLTQVLMRRH